MLCLGYYPEATKRIKTPRFDKKYIVFEDEYRHLNGDEFRDMYEEREKRVSPQNAFGAKNFGQLLYSIKFGSEFFEEMERSIGVILKHWNRSVE